MKKTLGCFCLLLLPFLLFSCEKIARYPLGEGDAFTVKLDTTVDSTSCNTDHSVDTHVDLWPKKTCDWSQPFTLSTPTPLTFLSTKKVYGDISFWKSRHDLLASVIVGQAQDGTYIYQLQHFTRDDVDGDFTDHSVIQNLGGINTIGGALSTDGLRLWLVARIADDYPTIYAYQKETLTDAFDPELGFNEIGLLPPLYNFIYDIHLSLDGKRLYYAPVKTGSQDIAVAHYNETDKKFEYKNLLENLKFQIEYTLHTSITADPTLNADQTTIIYIATDPKTNNSDLFYATRATVDDYFGTPKRVFPYDENNPADRDEPALSPDGCELIFRMGEDIEEMDSVDDYDYTFYSVTIQNY